MNSTQHNGYGPRRIGVSTRAVSPDAPRLRPIRTPDPTEPDAPTSPRAVERLHAVTGATSPPADMFSALKAVETLLAEAHQDRDRKRVVYASTPIGDGRRQVRKESWQTACDFADGVRETQRVLMGGAA